MKEIQGSQEEINYDTSETYKSVFPDNSFLSGSGTKGPIYKKKVFDIILGVTSKYAFAESKKKCLVFSTSALFS